MNQRLAYEKTLRPWTKGLSDDHVPTTAQDRIHKDRLNRGDYDPFLGLIRGGSSIPLVRILSVEE